MVKEFTGVNIFLIYISKSFNENSFPRLPYLILKNIQIKSSNEHFFNTKKDLTILTRKYWSTYLFQYVFEGPD